MSEPIRPTINWKRKVNKPELPPLYHGTNFKFNVGDVILPSSKAGVSSNYETQTIEYITSDGKKISIPPIEGLTENAYASYDIEEALHAAQRPVEKSGNVNAQARIFKVSPIAEDLDVDPNAVSAVRSRSGFKVEAELAGEELLAARRENFITHAINDLRLNRK